MLRERIGPAVQDPFAGEAARLAELLLVLNANWVDDAAAVRVAENAAIRALFNDAVPRITDSQLSATIAATSQSLDPGLRISQLDSENNRLRIDLDVLLAHFEAQNGSDAADMTRRIWQMLAQFEAARAPKS
jgi:hypothetical protein